ncbi:3-hydroxyisobutyrate dehydrogenase [Lasiodiplodia theobromae]|uniref:3-hydroxyisobutyrate dehydrogenase n=1 Tax=Lasiodiplodia theobromae TaxID=45133 RepID=UPI0015C3C74B|nr:3-hydroxyisobutyrate dehydrogenase [Lasiodiplodia theobromae]KAF4535982.1 3-hydroxyisobutyrate dehydrogenase [Lasiodiplodia theobromae]
MADDNVPIPDASEALLQAVDVPTKYDRFLRPSDGKLVPLLVQSFENGQPPSEQRSWTRIGKPQNQTPLFVRLSYWIWSPALKDGGSECKYSANTIGLVLARWLISLPLLLPLLGIFQISTRALKPHKRNANYDPVATKSEEDPDQRAGQGGDGVGTERTRDHSSSTDLQYLLDTLQNAQGADERVLHLSGIPGATIDWTCLDPAASQAVAGKRGRILAVLLSIIPVVVICALYILFIAGWIPREHFEIRFYILCGVGGLLMCLTAFVGLGATWLAVAPPDGDAQDLRPRLVGVEGHVDIRTIESHLFGFNHGRLAEVASSSREQYSDDVAQSPSAQESASGQTESGLVFTLVDTYTMTVYRFGAERPPVAAFICGNDDNLKTAVLCSYDWHTNTFCREAAIKVDSMTSERSRIRKVDFILLPFMWFVYGMPSLAYLNFQRPMNILYNASFILAQVPAYFLLRRAHIGQAISVPIWLKGAANLFIIIPPHHLGYALALFAVEGAVDGVIFLAFVVITCSWYTPRELLIRILVWTSGRHLLYMIPVHRLLYRDVDPDMAPISSPLPVVCVLLATYAFHYVGAFLPPSASNEMENQECTEYPYIPDPSGTYLPLQAVKIFKDIQLWLMFLLSALNKMLNLFSLMPVTSAALINICVVAFACIILSRLRVPLSKTSTSSLLFLFPTEKIAIAILFLILFATSTFVTLRHYTPSWFFYYLISNRPLAFLLFALSNLGTLIQPLIWTLICVNTPNADRRLATLCASFAGYALSLILLNAGLGQLIGLFDGSWTYVVVAVVELGLWVALGAWYVRKNRMKARGVQRAEGEEDEDEDEGEGTERAFRYSY